MLVFESFSKSDLRTLKHALEFYVKHNPTRNYFNFNSEENKLLLHKLKTMTEEK